MKAKSILLSGALFAILSVMIGAFGAHALQSILLGNGRLSTFETAVQYHIFHALALLIVGALEIKICSRQFRIAAIFFTVGIIIFSGSLYILAILNIPIMGAITPFGGVAFIIGWLFLMLGITKLKLS